MFIQQQIIAAGVLWSICIVVFLRAYFKGKVQSWFAQYTWLQIFLSVTIVSLHGPTIEAWIDQVFHYFPVTLYIKSGLMLLILFRYVILLRASVPEMPQLEIVKTLLKVTLVIGLFCLVLFPLTPMLGRETVRRVVFVQRDLISVILMIQVLIPGSIELYRREANSPARMKYLAIIITFWCFIGMAVVGIFETLLLAYSYEVEVLSDVVEPLMFVGILFYLVLVIPNRWLMAFFYPLQLYRCWQLRQLERKINHLTSITPIIEPHPWYRLFPIDALNLEIYRATIGILDSYPLLLEKSEYQTLYQQFDTVVKSNPEYKTLVRALIEVKL